jgi:hypothetical protein
LVIIHIIHDARLTQHKIMRIKFTVF